jgi:hypothetical protein
MVSVKYGDWFSVCSASLSAADSCYGGVFCLVRSGEDGESVRYILVSSTPSGFCSILNIRFVRLIFPRWDVIVIILSVFLMTYTYIEAKSNYHRGSILILRLVLVALYLIKCSLISRFSYLVLAAGFYYAPHIDDAVDEGQQVAKLSTGSLSFLQSVRLFFSSRL